MADDDEERERHWIAGNQAAWSAILQRAMGEITLSDDDRKAAGAVAERVRTVAALRELCDLVGDNDWPDNLYLPDVIEKHVIPYIEYKK